MKKIRNKTDRVRSFLRDDIWSVELENLSKARARFVKYIKVLLITIRTFSSQKIGFQSVALSFFCTMAVVPFIALTFAVTGGLGLADKLKEFLYATFDNSQQAIDTILGFAQNIIATAQNGTMGIISSLLFLWLIIWMMISIERVFNNVWKVDISRKFIRRLPFYLAMLIIAPLVIIAFFAGSMVYSHIFDYIGLDIEALKTFLNWVVFGFVITLTFSAMYKFIPNAHVDYSNALRAAAFSGVAFTVMQYLYLETQVFVTRLNAVYGAFAAVPLFMLWLNIGWFIILVGAEISYAFQNVDSYNTES